MPDHFIDDEAQELFGKFRIEVCIFGKLAHPGDLAFLAPRIGWWQIVFGLVPADGFGDAKPLCQHMDQRNVDIVDARAISGKDRIRGGGLVTHRGFASMA